jgi:hypothetical protein
MQSAVAAGASDRHFLTQTCDKFPSLLSPMKMSAKPRDQDWTFLRDRGAADGPVEEEHRSSSSNNSRSLSDIIPQFRRRRKKSRKRGNMTRDC